MSEESYRSKWVGSETYFDMYYAGAQLTRPAYVRTSVIIDTGITSTPTVDGPYYWFNCRTNLYIYDCNDHVIGTRSLGNTRGSMDADKIAKWYDEAREHVYGANVGEGTIIDIRTVEMSSAGCCPKELEGLMVE